MPTRKKLHHKSHAFTDGKLVQLISGHAWFDDSYGRDLTPEVLEEMRHDWFAHRDRIMADEMAATMREMHGKLWAETQFETGEHQ